MNPYYTDDLVTIYNADCRDVLPSIDPATVDLLLTDPPYGSNYSAVGASGWAKASRTAKRRVEGDDRPFDPSHLLPYGRCVLWGANYFAHLLPPGGWIVWDKTGAGQARSFLGDGELAWSNIGTSVHVYHYLWLGMLRGGEKGTHGLHPTQKPVALMRWIVDRWTEPGDLVLDPYMGSGPIAQACHELGRRYVGIEVEEDYCAIAVQRLGQESLMNWLASDA